MAYYAVQHVTSIFDNTLERIWTVAFSHSIDGQDIDKYWMSTDRSISVYGYEHKETHHRLYTIWKDDAIPGDSCELNYLEFAFVNSGFREPVFVDIITGNVYEISKDQWKKEENIDRFFHIPVYDAPILIAERSLLAVKPEK